MERSYYLSQLDSEIKPHHVTSFIRPTFGSKSPLAHVAEITSSNDPDQQLNEKELILEHLDKTGANVSKVARLLNISRTTLYKKINQYKIKIRR